jgi:POT family proton-dependent oligopeptide transporter
VGGAGLGHSRGFAKFPVGLSVTSTLQSPGGAAAGHARPGDRAFLGHPAGLGWLSFCELWERFSYYGMQALLVLYLANYLFKPENIGHVGGIDAFRVLINHIYGVRSTPQQFASATFGLYAGLVYLTPIFGGLIADRWLGRTKTVVTGATLMAIGHFLMAFEVSFLLALACLVVGVGCFKGNIAAQVGDLYAPGDTRRASAFQIFTLAVQIAVIGAPLVCGTLGEKVAWHWGFGAAGVGMVIGLFVYLAGRKWLPKEDNAATRRAAKTAPVEPVGKLSSNDITRLALLVLLIPVLMLSGVGNQQFNNAYPLWAEKNLDLVLLGFQVPVTWLQAVDAFVSTATMIAVIAFWKWWATKRKEPDELVKLAIGSLMAAGGPAMLIIACGIIDATHQKVSFAWTLAYTIVNDFGFANILPVGLSLYSRAAPRKLEGLVIGLFYLYLFFCNIFVGWLAGFLETMPGQKFWGMHAAMVAGAGVLFLVVKLLFGRVLEPTDEEDAAGEPAPSAA